jgi:hypothetical protein
MLDVLRQQIREHRADAGSHDEAEEKEAYAIRSYRVETHLYPLLDPQQCWRLPPAPLQVVIRPLLGTEDMDDNLAVV